MSALTLSIAYCLYPVSVPQTLLNFHMILPGSETQPTSPIPEDPYHFSTPLFWHLAVLIFQSSQKVR